VSPIEVDGLFVVEWRFSLAGQVAGQGGASLEIALLMAAVHP